MPGTTKGRSPTSRMYRADGSAIRPTRSSTRTYCSDLHGRPEARPPLTAGATSTTAVSAMDISHRRGRRFGARLSPGAWRFFSGKNRRALTQRQAARAQSNSRQKIGPHRVWWPKYPCRDSKRRQSTRFGSAMGLQARHLLFESGNSGVGH